MKNNYWMLITISLVMLIVLMTIYFSPEGEIAGAAIAPQDEKIRIGMPINPINGLLIVANDEGFFEEEGLNVEVIEFTGGHLSMQGTTI